MSRRYMLQRETTRPLLSRTLEMSILSDVESHQASDITPLLLMSRFDPLETEMNFFSPQLMSQTVTHVVRIVLT